MSDTLKKGDLRYDYEKQEYVDKRGQFVSIDYESFPCVKCGSPADMTSVSAYYEHYKCEAIDCGHKFTVN